MKYALLAAFLYALSSPISKLLLEFIGPTLMAACLYLGAGLGLLLVKKIKQTEEDKLETAKNKATVFSTKGNLSIIGSIVDDDGINKVEVYYCQGSQWDENNKKQLINAEVKGSTTYNLNKELRKDDGNDG